MTVTCTSRARASSADGLALVSVDQRVRSRAQLVDARLVGEVARGSGAAGDPITGQAGVDERLARLPQEASTPPAARGIVSASPRQWPG